MDWSTLALLCTVDYVSLQMREKKTEIWEGDRAGERE